jgi:ribosomal protein S18 acetylase RimI-like enzyme
MEAFLSKVRSLDSYNETTLWVLENNQRAKDFYERHGFQRDGASKYLNLANLEAETAVKAKALEVRYRRSL